MKIDQLNETLLAGISAFEKDEINSLFESVVKFIENLAIDKDESFVDELEKLFEILIYNGYAEKFAEYVSTEIYFDFGKFLLRDSESKQKIIHNYLDIFRRPEFLQRIYKERKWDKLIEDLIRAGNFGVKELFYQRAKFYGTKTLFRTLEGKKQHEYSWNDVKTKVERYSKALRTLISEFGEETKVAFLLENSLDMALLDLACLTSGIVNMMIPANSVPKHIELILNQAEAKLIFVANEKQLSKIKQIRSSLTSLEKIVLLSGSSIEKDVITFDEFLSYEKKYAIEKDLYTKKQIDVDSLATIMYTSGTTGEPKGITFTYMNIVYKRFCRAMAVPFLGDKDRYLSFLPLFHTFGRYLELMGSIFWGAEYTFMENPSVETMIENMDTVKPTIFISIPKKWLQLYEAITQIVNIELDDDSEIEDAVKKVTGGALRFGLSAAGFLPPEVFIFFQKYGVELMSGFGMTEATGGITMTPIGEYRENSLGKALPGIEIKLAEDGELLIRGAYVTPGYFLREKETFDKEGWLHTGDIMREDEDGFIEIIDRKKEIYKNIKGETIAPQKIENLFRGFDLVKQVFLVGDHMPYNTVLIYPNYDADIFSNHKYSESELKEIFVSIVESVNRFLAPFERILDFRIIGRAFSQENGELTPKGTYKRRIIEQNFDELISSMYKKQYIGLKLDEIEVSIPNWFLREKGKLSDEVYFSGNKIRFKNEEKFLILEKKGENLYRIGDYIYEIKGKKIDLQPFLTNPIYWIGNKNLYEFCGESIFQWYRNRDPEKNIKFISSESIIENPTAFSVMVNEFHVGGEKSLYALNIAVFLLQSNDEKGQLSAVNYLKFLTTDEALPIFKIVKEILSRPRITSFLSVRRNLLKAALHVFPANQIENLLTEFLSANVDIIDESVMNTLIELKSKNILSTIKSILEKELEGKEVISLTNSFIPSLFYFFEKYAAHHPKYYSTIREILVRYKLLSASEDVRKIASEVREKIKMNFRKWLGQNQILAIDTETGDEYTWDDVLIFEEMIDEVDKDIIRRVIYETPLVRESIFFFSKGVVIRLDDILPGGIWISFLNKFPTHNSYRVSVQTRFHGAFNFVINVNKTLNASQLELETDWLIISSSNVSGQILTDNFGGFWEKHGLWTQEYNPNESVGHYLERMSKRDDDKTREILYNIWGFFIWNATTSIINFAKLTQNKYRLNDTSVDNFIIPKHDYQTGTRIVSIQCRTEFGNEEEIIIDFYKQFIVPIIDKYTFLEKSSIPNYIYSGVISALGEFEGREFLEKFKNQIERSKQLSESEKENILIKLNEFLEKISDASFIPKRLFFAIKRFRRWKKINPQASLEAQAEMLNELFTTYRLEDLGKEFPETRTKFYFETCFDESNVELKNQIKTLIKLQHQKKIKRREMLTFLTEIKSKFELTEKEKYFLARISYSHLKPQDEADILRIAADGVTKENLVVQFFDQDGNPFIIRRPVSPKEISRLHSMFLEANLMVSFKSEHQFLVAVSQRGFIIGGLFYQPMDSKTVHMDKIVVANAYRRKGISDILMKEFFNRMKNENYEYVTTGFFRPEYFYKFGFVVERKYSGLVKKL